MDRLPLPVDRVTVTVVLVTMMDAAVMSLPALNETLPVPGLNAQVLGAVASPVQGAYNVLAAPLREFLVVLDQYIQKRQAEEAA